MKVHETVKRETIHIALGTAVLCAVMIVIFALIGKFDMSVLCGALLGSGFAIFNFFLLGLTVQRVTKEGNQGKAKSMMQFSYSVRMLATLLVALAGFALPYFNWVATFLPLLFPRITIFLMGLGNFKRKEEDS